MNHQQLLVVVSNEKEFQPSDEFLFDLAHQMLSAKKPSVWKIGMNIGRETLANSLLVREIAKFRQEKLSDDPEERSYLLMAAKPLVVELLRKIYVKDMTGLLPEVLVVGNSDQALSQYQSIDGYFAPNIVYSRHPSDPAFFIRIANFHGYLLQEKRAEFFRLVTALGAKAVRQCDANRMGVKGSSKVEASDPTQIFDLNMDSNLKSEKNSRFDLTASFEEATQPPRFPENMRWINHEPVWRAMAEARINNWVDRFTVSFTYSQDFNITADLVGKISEFGLSAGGSFSKFELIEQEYTVEFFPRSAYFA